MKRRTGVDRERLHHQSHLFTVRLWQEEVDNDQAEWRGKVQHLTSGEVRYFREWSVLLAFVLELLTKSESKPGRQ
jgi:hypothetical protein